MPDRRRQLGSWGEQQAAEYLQEAGYNIVTRNWRCARGEVDLIVKGPEGTLVFVEVRTRRGRRFGLAVESIGPRKQQRLIELAQTYLQQTDNFDCVWRIDVVTVQLHHGHAEIRHIPNAVGW